MKNQSVENGKKIGHDVAIGMSHMPEILTFIFFIMVALFVVRHLMKWRGHRQSGNFRGWG